MYYRIYIKNDIMTANIKEVLPYKNKAAYLCKSKEEQKMLSDYMVQICGFRPISELNNFTLYPGFSVTVQGDNYDTLIQSVPKFSPVFNEYSYETLICKTLDEFMEFLDYNNKIWNK